VSDPDHHRSTASQLPAPFLEAVLAGLAEGVVVADTAGRIVYINEAAAVLHGSARLGVAPQEYTDAYDLRTVEGAPFPAEALPLARAVRGETVVEARWSVRRPDGSVAVAVGSARPVHAPDGTALGAVLTCRDETERERALGALERERTRLRSIFTQAPFAIVVARGTTPESLVFEFVNRGYLAMLRPDVGDVTGRPMVEVIPDLIATMHPVLRRVLTAGEPFVANDLPLPLDRDGDGVPEMYWFTFIYHPFVDDDGTIDGVVCIGAEVTASVRGRQEAEQARAEAEAANRAKSEFLAVMSHELRTPLNAIGGYAELLEMGIRGPVTPQQREDLARIQRSQRHLLGLINEVLNYAKLETGSVRYDPEPVPAREALVEAESLVAPQARARGLTMQVRECPPGLVARADREKLRQILVNLLSNAVKFTDRGGVTLSCEASGAQLRFRVSDTGIGIPADKLAAIFEPFVQVRADLARPAEGTGLGLAISRDLARGMGGDIAVTSTPGAGSTFTLTLPRTTA
jgi:PAS domain S-box-containing protein